MKFKKTISLLLACTVVGGALTLSGTVLPDNSLEANAEDSYTYDMLTYAYLNDGTIEITDCDESAEDEIEIPREINGVKVTRIGIEAFYDCVGLTSITIPDSVTDISYYAFSGCINLTSISIPDSVTSIGSEAFSDCTSLTSITIGDSVTSIGNYAFYNCTSLISLAIPESVASIGNYAFCYCTSLESITAAENNETYTDIGGVLFNKECTKLICFPAGKTDTSYDIPDSVTSIGSEAFSDCTSLTSITIGDSVTSIGNYAFYNCTSLISLAIPESVTSIGEWAFKYCISMESVTIPSSVTSIGNCAFIECTGLTSITLLNPECEIYDSEYTISDTATIYGYENSTAQAYAEKYDRTFVKLTLFGDADLNGAVEIADAVKIMCYVTDPENNVIEPQGITNGDVYQTGDGLSVQDALSIQKYLAQIITELPEK